MVRPTSRDDASALGALYDRLSDADLYHRFFSVTHPGERFLASWCDVGARGGWGLLAEVHDPRHPTERQVVAEAGYVPDLGGEAELAICVDPHWRGWLGPFLLDAVLRAAADRGVDHVWADVLRENRPMVALARARGAEVVAQADPTEVRLRIPTGTRRRPVRRPRPERRDRR